MTRVLKSPLCSATKDGSFEIWYPLSIISPRGLPASSKSGAFHPYAVRGSLKDQGFAAAYRDHAILSGSGQACAAHAGHHDRCVLWNDKPWYRGSIRGRIVAGVYRRWALAA